MIIKPTKRSYVNVNKMAAYSQRDADMDYPFLSLQDVVIVVRDANELPLEPEQKKRLKPLRRMLANPYRHVKTQHTA